MIDLFGIGIIVYSAIFLTYVAYVLKTTHKKKCPCTAINLFLKAQCYECHKNCYTCKKLDQAETVCLTCTRKHDEKEAKKHMQNGEQYHSATLMEHQP